MNVVAAAVDSVVPKLLQLLQDEYKLQRGVKKNVESLSKELKAVHTFLCKVSDVPWNQLDEQVKEWASDIREASYDMEDILDTFLMRSEGREPTGRSRLKLAMNKMTDVFRKGKARHDVGSAIKDIMEQLLEVAARRARYRIEDLAVNSAASTSTTDPRLKAIYEEVARLVGIEKPSNDLIGLLSARQEENIVVSIFGTGGLGKTTLAKSVYNKLRPDFECGAFVPVGRNPNLAKLLMDILYELDKIRFADIHTKNRDERQLIDNLREFLLDKRYFIVIDDIWETTSWEETIRLALLENSHGSRIIITTRNSQVAKEIGDEVYRMQPLSDDNSKNLFYTRIFGEKENWPDNEPDKISNKILKKCDGVPLAIITIASLLVGKPRERWSKVFTSVGFGHKDDKHVDNTMKIVSFSYYDMPAYLRTCLLYLSVFPEDYTIDKESLVRRWIAEGFIQGEPGIQLFELGEQYFNDLVNRSMILAMEDKSNGMLQGCRVHDMVLDLIRSISSEENFVTILDNDEGTVSPPPRNARRLALHDNTMDCTAHGNTVDMPQVRSFVAIRCAFGNWIPFSRCKLLRVLDLENCSNVRPSHLVHLGNLHHLRYLSLKYCTQIDKLPNEIGDLKFLMTLNLEGTEHMEQKDLEFLGRLPELCYLSLFTESTVTISNFNAGNGYFRKLRFCCMCWSMIFLCEEGDSSVSFHLWNGIDAMPFGSSKNNCSLAPYSVMPNLEKHLSQIFVRALNDSKVDCSNIIDFEYAPSLQNVQVWINCAGASAAEVDEAEAAVRKATKVHPNRPTLEMVRRNEDEMISAVQDQKPEEDDVSVEEEDQKQQEEQPTADEDVTKSSTVNS